MDDSGCGERLPLRLWLGVCLNHILGACTVPQRQTWRGRPFKPISLLAPLRRPQNNGDVRLWTPRGKEIKFFSPRRRVHTSPAAGK